MARSNYSLQVCYDEFFILLVPRLQTLYSIDREGLQSAPHRFEMYRGLVQCYIALQRSREALTIAGNSLHHIGHTPRTFTVNIHANK